MTNFKTIAFGAALLTASCFALAAPVVNAPSSAGSAHAVHFAESEDTAIQPFRVHIPQVALNDLRRRVRATHWPDKETVDDASQGVQLATLQAHMKYWGYDWRNWARRTVNARSSVALVRADRISSITISWRWAA